MDNQINEAPAVSGGVALLIRHKVKPSQIPRYEKWLSIITKAAAQYEGHQGLNVIRPSEGQNEYTIVIHYRSLESAEKWTKSAERKKLVEEIADAFVENEKPEIQPGIEFWFTPPAAGKKAPPAWKQWLITTSVIWPLTIVIPMGMRPLFGAVPFLATPGLREGLVAAIIVALVVFLIMPRYVRAVSGWLNK
jgi:Uncharacterized protein conserved in bacteria